jgi:hypothetical protein
MIARSTAGSTKKVTLELGGKAANIVFDDAPVDQAVEGIVNGIFFNQGHVCCAGSRLLVQESAYDEVLSSLKRRLGTLRWATRWTRTPTSARSTRPSSWPGSASCPTSARPRAPTGGRRRATCRTRASGSRRPCSPASRRRTASPARRSSGRSCRCSPSARRRGCREGQQHAVRAVRGVWTDKGSRILWMADQLRAGVVWANTFNRFDPASPFGGYKESGYGREGGRHGLEAYLDV